MNREPVRTQLQQKLCRPSPADKLTMEVSWPNNAAKAQIAAQSETTQLGALEHSKTLSMSCLRAAQWQRHIRHLTLRVGPKQIHSYRSHKQSSL